MYLKHLFRRFADWVFGKTPNTLFPGRPNYTGPTQGMFGLLHHEVLFESSHNVAERVAYVKANKPPHEVAVRLHNMIYLGACEAPGKVAPLIADYCAKVAALKADYEAKRAALEADYLAKVAPLNADYRAKVAPLDADYEAKVAALYADYRAKVDALEADYWAKVAPLYAEILGYIRAQIPDCAWDPENKTLVFPKA